MQSHSVSGKRGFICAMGLFFVVVAGKNHIPFFTSDKLCKELCFYMPFVWKLCFGHAYVYMYMMCMLTNLVFGFFIANWVVWNELALRTYKVLTYPYFIFHSYSTCTIHGNEKRVHSNWELWEMPASYFWYSAAQLWKPLQSLVGNTYHYALELSCTDWLLILSRLQLAKR